MFKQTNNMEDLRYYKHLKNGINNQIAKERYLRKVKSFQQEDSSPKSIWNTQTNYFYYEENHSKKSMKIQK